jgi:hypothetical protein
LLLHSSHSRNSDLVFNFSETQFRVSARRAFARRRIPMAKHVLAIQPQLAVEPGAHEEYLARPEEIWNQEQEVHARAVSKRPEESREQVQSLIPGLDLKRLVL